MSRLRCLPVPSMCEEVSSSDFRASTPTSPPAPHLGRSASVTAGFTGSPHLGLSEEGAEGAADDGVEPSANGGCMQIYVQVKCNSDQLDVFQPNSYHNYASIANMPNCKLITKHTSDLCPMKKELLLIARLSFCTLTGNTRRGHVFSESMKVKRTDKVVINPPAAFCVNPASTYYWVNAILARFFFLTFDQHCI